MQHSVQQIGNRYQKISEMRKDKTTFNADKFVQFAKDNSKKYGIIDLGYMLTVSTWHSNDLILDFQKQEGIKS